MAHLALPDHVLFSLFDYVYGPDPRFECHWDLSPPPTDEELQYVEDCLQTTLPPLLVKLARTSPYYDQAFLALDDPKRCPAGSLSHIVAGNEFWNKEGKPEDLILISHGYDGDCDCFRRQEEEYNPQTPIEYVAVGDGHSSDLKVLAQNFREYLQDRCLYLASRLRPKSLHKKVKKLLAEWEIEF